VSATDSTSAFDEPAAALPLAPAVPVERPAIGPRRYSLRSLLERAQPRHAALAAVLALSAVLNTWSLAQNGYANTFYSAAARSMLGSLHNFLFASFDPGGLVTIDKPPLAVWVQAASAELFGISPLSLLLPEAIISVISVAVLYRVIGRRLGPAAGLLSALALAVFPAFVAVSRDNGVDPLLILLMILAGGAALNAIDSGRLRWLICSAVLVGLAFNTKTLAAYLVVPGIALAYAVCGSASLPRRAANLLVAGLVMLAVSFSWIALVELTPASQRPFVGSSTNNTELGLTFDYNGFGRVEGEVGGPGRIPIAEGAGLHIPPLPSLVRPPGSGGPGLAARGGGLGAPLGGVPTPDSARGPALTPAPGVDRTRAGGRGAFAAGETPASRTPRAPAPTANSTAGSARARARVGQAPGVAGTAGPGAAPRAQTGPPRVSRPHHASKYQPDGRLSTPLVFGEPTGPLRLFESGLADQGAWLLPFALIGLLALCLQAFAGERARRNRRLATTIVFGGWLLVEVAILSFSKGIVHPYYVSAMAPGVAAMLGGGAVALASFARRRHWGLVLLPCAVATTVLAQLSILHQQQFMGWFAPILIAVAAVGVCACAARRLVGAALALTLAVLLVAPTVYAANTWQFPVNGTFPAAGPHEAPGSGAYGVPQRSMRIDRRLIAYVRSHHPTERWALLTVASPTAAPFILLGLRAGAIAGYSGTDPVLTGPGLARLVARDEARYVALGGAYAARGGSLATRAVLRACRHVPARAWHGPAATSIYSLVLFDCAGRERRLSEPARAAAPPR
jgi:4-amino-4-deoxy-L-arabinose transferase-like glycosyltransferase